MGIRKMTWPNDPYHGMFTDVVRALSRKAKGKEGFVAWLEERETFIAMEIAKAQDTIASMYKDRERITLDEFGDFIKKHYWENFKEGIRRYDQRPKEEREREAGIGDKRDSFQGEGS
jgi:hypothetical protein